MRLLKFALFLGIFTALAFLTGCSSDNTIPTGTPVIPTSAATSTVQPTQPVFTPTAVPPKSLVICTQQEPETLYIYGGSSRSMWSVLEAIYDGPFDTRGFSVQPVILEEIPTLADGDAVIQTVSVRAGDSVIDVKGNLVALQAGVTVLPAGCTAPDCAVTWDGASDLSMDQLSATFRLMEGLRWSDGEPLSAADSVFSYSLAADPSTPTSKYLTDRTFSYTAVDERTVTWVGLPGFYEQRFGTFFWTPLPKHQFGTKGAADLLVDESAARSPIGWGPFVIDEWTAGDHITLRKNPNYFRANESLPKIETLVYRFIGDTADGNLNALLAGECDAVDQNSQFLSLAQGLVDRKTSGKLALYTGEGPEWEHLDFGIRPAAYDDGYNPAVDRPDLFGDVRTRQAAAHCINRETINKQILFGWSSVPGSFLPASHPFANADVSAYAYDPNKGMQLLDETGWKDADGSVETPRTAQGVAGVPDGTNLAVTYMTTEAPLRKQVAEEAARTLRECGFQVNVQVTNPGELFGPGPDGFVFGRKFDLVQFSWEASARPNCLLYASSQVPDGTNRWIGANVSGYSSQEYDAACLVDQFARPAGDGPTPESQQIQGLFARDLPALPLYFYPKIAISRPDLCGLEMDVSARSIFWNIEAIDYGQECSQ